ncbi:ATP-dependent DNA ligase [Candidatus Nanohalococcus occultus]|uniref:ATP-dependent DNA ligase n=1 Tax=Candidatus Nanohalococcus occultus TaxID=2978047 RepID=UPI0039E0026A
MEYSKLVELYEQLDSTQSTLEMTSILAEFFRENDELLEDIVLLAMGRPFPYWKNMDIGISSKTMLEIIEEATGRSKSEIEEVWRDEGDLGYAAEEMVRTKTQRKLGSKDLTVERVVDTLEKVAKMGSGGGETGKVSMDKKKSEVSALISDADPVEAKWIARTFIENLRLGVGEGTIRDALSEAFFEGEYKESIQRAYDLTNDFQEVARACREGIEKVESLEIEVFRPIKSMLAKKVESIEEGFEEVGKPAAIDYKYDGVRAQIHIKDGEVKIFTRRLEDITEQFPDAVEAIKNHVNAENAIIDSEIVAYDPEDGSSIPFQQLSRRVKRKYDIQKLKREIPVEVRPFDLIYLEGSMIDTPYSQRYESLENIVSERKQELRMVDHDVTDDPERVHELDQAALSEGQEGIMMKSVDAVYKPGNRVGYMVKLKPVMETLDLAVIGAKWGEGRRSGWLSRLKLGCWSEEKQEYVMIGRMATGLTDEELEEITERLKPLIVEEDGRDVTVKPDVIVEAEYEEIQKSPNYSSGYALRFPRLKSFRDDKEDADSLEKVQNLYDGQ